MSDARTHEEVLTEVPPTVRLEAWYGSVPWPCPEQIVLECPNAVSVYAMRDLIHALARVPQLARPHAEDEHDAPPNPFDRPTSATVDNW